MLWTARQFEYRFPRPALVMGIVNVTPDSFSDGGRYFSTDDAVRHALELVAQGAELIDVGGESTRPGAEPVSEAEELRRVIPVIERLATRGGVVLSIDTMKPAVAEEAIRAGAVIVNDVGASRGAGDTMWRLVAGTGAGYVCMHMQGNPRTMQVAPVYEDVVAQTRSFFEERLEALGRAGVRREQVVLDVGIGFGKTADHNLQLLGALRRFTTIGRPMMLGVSRKSFIGKVLGAELADRMPASLACAGWGVREGVSILRVHDVSETVQAVRMTEAIVKSEQH
jgi:dihydropteroate synthase